MTLLQIFTLTLAAGVLYPLLKSYLPQYAPVLAVAISLGAAALLISAGMEVFRWIWQIGQAVNSEAFQALLKAAGILFCSQWCCDLCSDNGLTSVADCIDAAGRGLALAAAFPLLQSFYTLITGLLA